MALDHELTASVRDSAYGKIMVGVSQYNVANTLYDFMELHDLYNWRQQQYATLETGELRVVEEGNKGRLMEIRIRTSADGTIMPGLVGAIKSLDDSDWTWLGDSTGTISVTDAACTGTGTAWSNCLGLGDDTATVFGVPAPPGVCRVYRDSALLESGTDYTEGSSSITLSSPLLTGEKLYAYWPGEPVVRAKVGDYIRTSEGFHRIETIPTATSCTLEWYPETTVTGYHCYGRALTTGESKLADLPVNRTFNTIQVKIVIVPRLTSDMTYCLIDGIELKWIDSSTQRLHKPR